MEKQIRAAGSDQIEPGTLNPLLFPITDTCLPSLPWQLPKYRCWLITFAGKEKETQKQICENIILFVELRNEHGSQSPRSNFISCVVSKPHKSPTVLQESLTTVAAWHQAKDDKPRDIFSSASSRTMEVLNVNFRPRMLTRVLRAEEMSLWWRAGGHGSWPSWTWPGRRFSSQH